MELESVNTIRKRYRDLLSTDKTYNNILKALTEKDKADPILNIGDINAESDLHYAEEQRQLSEILLDMHSINNGIIEAKNIIQSTVSTLDDSIYTILNSVQKQRDQIEDVNVICGKNSEYSSILPVYTSSFENLDAEIINDRTVGAIATESNSVSYDIVSVAGNGYSGNAFVYTEDGFENLSYDRSNVDYIMDNNDLTIYEYSRLCTRDKKEVISGIVNYDDKEVECVITLMASKAVCKAAIKS